MPICSGSTGAPAVCSLFRNSANGRSCSLKSDTGQFTLPKQPADGVFASRLARKLATTVVHIQCFQGLRQHILIESTGSQRPDAHFETMRRGGAVMRVVLHVP